MCRCAVWLFYTRSLNCCLEVRAKLGCSADYTQPCREHAGDCSALPDLFRGFQDDANTYALDPAYSCHQFPDTEDDAVNGNRDKWIVSLIAVAVALPFSTVVEELFVRGSNPEHPERAVTWPLALIAVFGRQRWRWAASSGGEPPGALRLVLARFARDPMVIPLALISSAGRWIAAAAMGDGGEEPAAARRSHARPAVARTGSALARSPTLECLS